MNDKALGEQRIYVYVDKKNIDVGSVWKNSNGTYGITFDKTKIPKFMWPVTLFGFEGNDDYTGDSATIAFWLQERVVPETRQNLSDVLRRYGLQRYDVWELIKRGNGNIGTDHIYIGQEWHPSKIKKMYANKPMEF